MNDLKTYRFEERSDITSRYTFLPELNFIWTAIKTFTKIVNKNDWKLIVDMINSTGNYFIVWAGCEAFIKLAKPEDRDLIYKMLEDTVFNFRWAGLEALKKFVKPCDREIILKLLDDEDENVRCSALVALSKVVKIEDRKKILQMLNKEIRGAENAIIALERIVKLEDIDQLLIKLWHYPIDNNKKNIEKVLLALINSNNYKILIEKCRNIENLVYSSSYNKFEETKSADSIAEILKKSIKDSDYNLLLNSLADIVFKENISLISTLLKHLDKKIFCPIK